MATQITVSLDIQDETLRHEIETILAGQKGFRLHTAVDSHAPQLVMIEMDRDRTKTFDRVELILQQAPDTEVFLTASETDSNTLIEALRAGVKEFLPQPLQRDEFVQALARYRARYKAGDGALQTQGCIFNVTGGKGGVGATTVAVNLAMSLQQAHQTKRTVLVDLQPQFGDIALFLDLQPSYTMGDIAKNLARLDSTFMTRVLTQHTSGLPVLPSSQTYDDIGLLTPDVVTQTLTVLQGMFDYIVLDSGHGISEATLTALTMSQKLLLVTALTLPVLRNTKRFMELSTRLEYPPEQIKLVVNRYNAKNTDISLDDLKSTLDVGTYWTIPNEFSTTVDAINKGKPLNTAKKNSKINKSIYDLALDITELTKSGNRFKKFMNK
jgi:pilus assembly protein CpaE